tara:strand:- start:44 stop:283 length:240 start_codon:yes stop_codon:yes gene_type:complete
MKLFKVKGTNLEKKDHLGYLIVNPERVIKYIIAKDMESAEVKYLEVEKKCVNNISISYLCDRDNIIPTLEAARVNKYLD